MQAHEMKTLKNFKGRLQKVKELRVEAADLFCVNADDILKTRHSERMTIARFYLYRRMRDMGWSTPLIGILIGRDHASVMNGLRRFEEAKNNINSPYNKYLREAGLC